MFKRITCSALFTFFVAISHAFAQNSNADNIYLKVLTPLQFRYASAYELARPLELMNALELHIKVKQQPVKLLASVAIADPKARTALAGKLHLRQNSTNSSTVSNVNTTVPLTEVPAELFLQPAAGNATKHYYFYYDLVLEPLKSFISSGNYGFTVTFTMTTP